MSRTAVYRSPLFLEHLRNFGHVESPERLRVVYQELDRDNTAPHLLFPSFQAAPHEIIALNHSQEHIRHIAATAGCLVDYLDADTQTSARSYDAALLAAGALVDGLERLAEGDIDNGFALLRPPGHHATPERAMGFCLFNNIAIAAHYAVQKLNLAPVFIFDWDLHHGNGTQDAFYASDQVFYCSAHQYPHYPGSGGVEETGSGKGQGFTINIPLPGGQDDRAYARICRELVVPLVRQYRPRVLLLSCGFDIALGDPLGAMRVSPAGFAYMTRTLRRLADEVCEGRLLVTLEGGYSMKAMRDGSLAVLTELSGAPLHERYPVWLDEATARDLDGESPPLVALDQAIQVAKRYWTL
ncbi:MAG: histone deacetylase [Desulfobulbaceae bacterium A2]|nr:MAG: histone deacetylase [Desulfobulbaceae bacterium A2]